MAGISTLASRRARSLKRQAPRARLLRAPAPPPSRSPWSSRRSSSRSPISTPSSPRKPPRRRRPRLI